MEDLSPIGRLGSVSSTTGGAFEQELRQLLLQRTRLLFLVGVFASAVVIGAYQYLADVQPALERGLIPWRDGVRIGHMLSFAAALGATYLFQLSARQLQVLSFAVLAANIVVAMFIVSSTLPEQHPYIVVGVGLFAYAAFIPSRAKYAAALAVLAILSFALAAILTYNLVPDAEAFWEPRGGIAGLRIHLITGVAGFSIFGVIAWLTSRTLYSLRKVAHRAKRLGNYLLRREIGSGGMGQVFFAHHHLMCRPTAVKVMRPSGAEADTALARFEREIRISATLTHPNTITIYDVGRTADRSLYYAMEYLEGLDLQALVERFGPMPAARVIHILRQVCGSLAEAHSRHIIHRDIKPSNIYLTRRGGIYDFVKVLDFGLAKEIRSDEAASLTKSGTVFGTPQFLAPETVYGNDAIDARADIYCVGGVAYWMLAGQPPFTSTSSIEVLVDHVKTAPRPPSQVSELSIPSALEAIVMRCLEKKPTDRFSSAVELDQALEAVPLESHWTRAGAEEWWSLHGIIGEQAHDHDCFFGGECQDEDIELSSPVAAEVG